MIYMLHSVGNTHTDWVYRFLSIRLNNIENLFGYLNKKKIQTYFVKDLYEYDFNIPKNGISLTFDDGYLDNWVYLFSLLKKYNIKATIFVNPEFVDPREIVREKLSYEVQTADADKALGFLSWDEMRIMEKSGLVDIQSHSMSHTWYFTSPKLIDFFSPIEIQKNKVWDKQYPWVSWNEKKEEKPFTHNSFAYNSKKFGLPILENGRSLGIKRFFPEEDILSGMTEYAKSNSDIFLNDWFQVLGKKYNELTKGTDIKGRYETDKEVEERYFYELSQSKKIIQEKLNKEVTILCWPGGIYNDLSIRISESAGYIASTIASREKNLVDNRRKKYKRIPRRPMSANVNVNGKNLGPSHLHKVLIHRIFPTPVFSSSLLKTEKAFRLLLNK